MPNWTNSTPPVNGANVLSYKFIMRIPGIAQDGSQDTIGQANGATIANACVGTITQAFSPLLTNISNAGVGYVFISAANNVITSNTIPGSVVSGNISGSASSITGNLSSNQITIGLGYTPFNSSNINAVSNSTQLGLNSNTEVATTYSTQNFVSKYIKANANTQFFTGTGANQSFTISSNTATANDVAVYVYGVRQTPNTYVVTNGTGYITAPSDATVLIQLAGGPGGPIGPVGNSNNLALIDLTNVNWSTVSNTVLTSIFTAMTNAGLFANFLTN